MSTAISPARLNDDCAGLHSALWAPKPDLRLDHFPSQRWIILRSSSCYRQVRAPPGGADAATVPFLVGPGDSSGQRQSGCSSMVLAPIVLLYKILCSRPRWEPSWEPFAVDLRGRLWTPMDTKPSHDWLCGRLWTPVDAAWRSTDQEVGGSSPSGRAPKPSQERGLLSWRSFPSDSGNGAPDRAGWSVFCSRRPLSSRPGHRGCMRLRRIAR